MFSLLSIACAFNAGTYPTLNILAIEMFGLIVRAIVGAYTMFSAVSLERQVSSALPTDIGCCINVGFRRGPATRVVYGTSADLS